MMQLAGQMAIEAETGRYPVPQRSSGVRASLLSLGALRIEHDARLRGATLSLADDAPASLCAALERCRAVRAKVGGFAGLVVFREGRVPGTYAIHTRLTAHAGQLVELGWTLERRLEMFVGVARAVQGLHEVGEAVGVLSPYHVLLNAGHAPHVLGPGVRLDETRAYEAPESRLEGRFDRRSDVFCLGALLGFLVGGRAPEAHEGELAPLSHIGPRGLRRIVRKACAVAPEQRYESVYELLFDLTRHMDADGVGLGHAVDALPGAGSGARRLPSGLEHCVRPSFAAE